jgi:hypothetical protein
MQILIPPVFFSYTTIGLIHLYSSTSSIIHASNILSSPTSPSLCTLDLTYKACGTLALLLVSVEYSSHLSLLLSPSFLKMSLGIGIGILLVILKSSLLSHHSNNLLSTQTWDSLLSQCLASTSLSTVCIERTQDLALLLLILLPF